MGGKWVLSISVLTVSLLFGSTVLAQSRTFHIRNDGGSRIQFISDAPLETITGVSSHVTGDVTVDPSNLSEVRSEVQVRIASIRTGIQLRDEHLRGENWLDAGRFPNATFEITRVSGASALRPNTPARVQLQGRFSLHGVTRDVTASARVRLIPSSDELRSHGINGDVLRVQAHFSIRLSDYDVSILLPVRLKVSNEISVNVTLRAVTDDA